MDDEDYNSKIVSAAVVMCKYEHEYIVAKNNKEPWYKLLDISRKAEIARKELRDITDKMIEAAG